MHVQVWRETYAGIMPEERLAALSVAERTQRWRDHIALPAPDAALFVAFNGPVIVGFGHCGRQRSKQLDFAGEINALNILKEFQRAGVGRTLMGAMKEHLQACGMTSASLWVVKENAAARAFYEALGGRAVAEKTEHRDGYALNEIAYGWRELEGLGRRA